MMCAFADVLAAVEASAATLTENNGISPITYRLSSEPADARPHFQVSDRKNYAAAYESEFSFAQESVADIPLSKPALAKSPPELGTLLKELRFAKHSIRKLQKLRRDVARQCHPDLWRPAEDQGNLLSEMNARIDAAIDALHRAKQEDKISAKKSSR
jgi:hypothetical protein